MLETTVVSVDALSTSEAAIFSTDSEGTPEISVPRDSRDNELSICWLHVHPSRRCSLNWQLLLDRLILYKTLQNQKHCKIHASKHQTLAHYLETWGGNGLDDGASLIQAPAGHWVQGGQRGNQHRWGHGSDLADGQARTGVAENPKRLLSDDLDVWCQGSRHLLNNANTINFSFMYFSKRSLISVSVLKKNYYYPFILF